MALVVGGLLGPQLVTGGLGATPSPTPTPTPTGSFVGSTLTAVLLASDGDDDPFDIDAERTQLTS